MVRLSINNIYISLFQSHIKQFINVNIIYTERGYREGIFNCKIQFEHMQKVFLAHYSKEFVDMKQLQWRIQ